MRSVLTRGFEPRAVMMVITVMLLLMSIAYPLSLVLLKSFSIGETFAWGNYLKMAADPLSVKALLNTLYVGAVTTLVATLIGVATAFLLARTDLPGRGVFRALIFLTFITPAYIGAVAWIQLLGRAGYINKLLMNIFNLSVPPIELYSLEGIIFVMAVHLYPLVFLTTYNALRMADPLLEDAAASSGGTKFRILNTITLPLVLPSILSGAALVFLQTISCFAVAAAIGLPTGNYVLTTRIYAALSHYDVRMACAVSIILVLITGIVLFGHDKLLGRKRYTVTTSGSRRPTPIELGKWGLPIAVALFVFISVTLLLPLASILLSSFLKLWGLPPTSGNLTLGNYMKIFSDPLTGRAMRNSLMFAGSAATGAVLIGLINSYFSTRTKVMGRQFLDFLTTMPLAIPGPVLATAMILAFFKPPLGLYGTPWIIIVAYIAAFIPYAVRNISGTLKGMDPTLEEIGWVSGASWARTMKDITVPLIRPGIWTGWILVFLMALREIPLSTMLYAQHTKTIGVLLFSKTEEGELEMVSAIAVIVMAAVIIGQLIVERFGSSRMEVA